MYTFGTQLWTGLLGEILAYLITYVMFLPVLYNLQVTSVYEYLQRRFSPGMRTLGSVLFLTGNVSNTVLAKTNLVGSPKSAFISPDALNMAPRLNEPFIHKISRIYVGREII